MAEVKCGDIVYLQKYKTMLAEVLTLTDREKALVRMCDTGLEFEVSTEELGKTESSQPCLASGRVAHILGVPYKVVIVEDDDYRSDKEADGWCDTTTKELLVFNFKQSFNSKRDLIEYQHKVIRHEIIHAFLYESGLDCNTLEAEQWAKNEEMVDWMAIQIPKILKAFREVGCVSLREEG